MRHIIILLALLSVSCSSSLPSFKPFRMDIQQGNVVTSKMVMQLRPGMTKSQVRFIMGTPLIQDGFRSNRWDYFYQMRQEGKIIEQRRVILEFENEGLARVRGDVIPAGDGQQELATPATTPESLSKSTKTEAKKDEKGLVDKLKFWKSDEEKKSEESLMVAPVPVEGEALAPTAVGPAIEPPIERSSSSTTESAPTSALPEVSQPAAVTDQAPREPAPVEEPTPKSVEVAPMSTPEPVAAPVDLSETPRPANEAAPRSVPLEQAPVNEESFGLLFDRSIDLPMDDANPSNVSNPSLATDADLPSEASPDFFERMLEKIGF
ncbi:MAG: outer membrane protein assembly factor BamE [Methylophilaceae bacterium]|nr:outer membrane protein assembly factor BamE [Methylophilaceae bacterium]